MSRFHRSRPAGLIPLVLLAGLPAASTWALGPVTTSAVVLDRYVISASRTPQDPAYTPSSVSVLPLEELALAQIPDLRTALAEAPGLVVSNTGPTGGPSSIFLRGANAHQTLFVVDGVRMNDRSASYQTFLGGADLVGLDRMEILRGPQSTLYGSSAMGGVILMNTTTGRGPLTGTAAATAGSFDTLGGSLAVRGATSQLAYSAAAARFQTANDTPRNDFDQWSYATRLEWTASDALLLGVTFRGQNSGYEQTGSRFYPAPGKVDNDNYLGTVFAQAGVAETFTSRLTLALHQRNYDWTDRSGSPWGVNSALRNTRKIADWQNTWTALPELELVAGVNYERSRYEVDGAPSRDDVTAGYLSATAHPLEEVTLTAGVRRDDFESVGGANTWRAGAAWLPVKTTKLRATYGTGFGAPGSDDRYGVASWGQLPNAALRPERSRGWDAGIDQTLPGTDVTVSATYFQNRFSDLFDWQTVDFTTYQGRTVNVARARTEGVELMTRAHLGAVETRVSYTYLDARDTTTGARLIRRPRHNGDGEVRMRLGKPWVIGAGVHFAADRTEVTGPFGGYTTVRLFTQYAVTDALTLKLRVENLLGKSYEDVRGYPALPRGAFGAIEWKF
jgi:vitamin B12 transporter